MLKIRNLLVNAASRLRLLTNKKLSAVFLFCCLCDNISVVVDDFVPSVQTLRLHDFFV